MDDADATALVEEINNLPSGVDIERAVHIWALIFGLDANAPHAAPLH